MGGWVGTAVVLTTEGHRRNLNSTMGFNELEGFGILEVHVREEQRRFSYVSSPAR